MRAVIVEIKQIAVHISKYVIHADLSFQKALRSVTLSGGASQYSMYDISLHPHCSQEREKHNFIEYVKKQVIVLSKFTFTVLIIQYDVDWGSKLFGAVAIVLAHCDICSTHFGPKYVAIVHFCVLLKRNRMESSNFDCFAVFEADIVKKQGWSIQPKPFNPTIVFDD